MVDEAIRHAMEATNKSKIYGIIRIVLDTPQIGGAKAAPRAGKGKSHQTASTVARRATQRASARRNEPIQTRPNRGEATQIGVRDGTMQKA